MAQENYPFPAIFEGREEIPEWMDTKKVLGEEIFRHKNRPGWKEQLVTIAVCIEDIGSWIDEGSGEGRDAPTRWKECLDKLKVNCERAFHPQHRSGSPKPLTVTGQIRSGIWSRHAQGVVIRADGLIATSAATITGSSVVTVTMPDGDSYSALEYFVDEPIYGLALVKVSARTRLRLSLGDSRNLAVGDCLRTGHNGTGTTLKVKSIDAVNGLKVEADKAGKKVADIDIGAPLWKDGRIVAMRTHAGLLPIHHAQDLASRPSLKYISCGLGGRWKELDSVTRRQTLSMGRAFASLEDLYQNKWKGTLSPSGESAVRGGSDDVLEVLQLMTIAALDIRKDLHEEKCGRPVEERGKLMDISTVEGRRLWFGRRVDGWRRKHVEDENPHWGSLDEAPRPTGNEPQKRPKEPEAPARNPDSIIAEGNLKVGRFELCVLYRLEPLEKRIVDLAIALWQQVTYGIGELTAAELRELHVGLRARSKDFASFKHHKGSSVDGLRSGAPTVEQLDMLVVFLRLSCGMAAGAIPRAFPSLYGNARIVRRVRKVWTETGRQEEREEEELEALDIALQHLPPVRGGEPSREGRLGIAIWQAFGDFSDFIATRLAVSIESVYTLNNIAKDAVRHRAKNRVNSGKEDR